MSKQRCYVSKFGDKKWYIDDDLTPHRTDGPAIEWADGDKEWWLYGKKYKSLDEFLDKAPISYEEKIGLKLTYMTDFS